MKTLTSLAVLAMALAAGAAAQTPAPAQAPRPQQPAATPAATVVAPPARTPPPAPPASHAAPGAPRAAAVASPVQPVARAGTPVDSAKPRTAAALPPVPANAVAQCKDGAFVTLPSDASACSSHRGVLVRFPVKSTPRPASALSAASMASMRTAPAPTPADAPPGSTMQCKDGTFFSGPPSEGRCGAHGGLAVMLPAARTTPTPPPTPPQGKHP
jgi:hypothetical protein